MYPNERLFLGSSLHTSHFLNAHIIARHLIMETVPVHWYFDSKSSVLSDQKTGDRKYEKKII